VTTKGRLYVAGGVTTLIGVVIILVMRAVVDENRDSIGLGLVFLLGTVLVVIGLGFLIGAVTSRKMR
jgi:hypothetical protein